MAKDHFAHFVQGLQKRYPFAFATAYRDIHSELNKQKQERLTAHFLFGAVAELSHLAPEKKEFVWKLGDLLSKTIRKGGENFRPAPFTPEQVALARQLTPIEYDMLMQKLEDLSLGMQFKLGPVNSAEHAMAWCFRYVRLLLEAAKWESKQTTKNPVQRTASPQKPGSDRSE